MNIGINDAHEVVLITDGIELTGTEEMSVYTVESVPPREPGKKLCFDPEYERFYFKAYTAEEKEAMQAAHEKFRRREEARKKKAEALIWLSENDWKINKRFLGEWQEDDERWTAYVAERAEMRRIIDESDGILNT